MRDQGSYQPGINEKVVETVNANILSETVAVHVRATNSFTDQQGKQRCVGEEWLVTHKEVPAYIPDVYEQVTCTTAAVTQ